MRYFNYKVRLVFPFFTLAFIVFAGCKYFSSDKNSGQNTNESLKSNIIGKWGGLGEAPVWDIRADSIHYIDLDSTYPYYFKGDTMFVNYPEIDTATSFGTIQIIDDTLKIKQYYRGGFVVMGYRSKK